MANPVSEEEAREWADAYDGGSTIEQIALDCGRSYRCVYRWLHKLGVEMRPANGQGHKTNRTNLIDGRPVVNPYVRDRGAILRGAVKQGKRRHTTY